MIEYVEGDLLEAQEDVIAHGCNCKGKMGSGVAKQIRDKWPHVYECYKTVEESGWGLRLGHLHLVIINDHQKIANLLTQEDYGKNKNTVYVDYDAVDSCFKLLDETLKEGESVAIPKIGSGLANGDWERIEEIINDRMSDRRVVCYVQEKDPND